MIRIFVFVSFAVLASASLHGRCLAPTNQLSDITKETSYEQAETPRDYLESRLGGKILKLERDPEALLRAVLFVERKGSVSQHVMKATLNSESDVREVIVATPNGEVEGLPPVVVMPHSLITPCLSQCKGKCPDTECRVRCLFDCIID